MASSSSSTRTWQYDVFLSFRGPDTRKNIVSHLYSALCKKQINTFKDDRSIEKGDSIPEELIKAIRTSQFAIIVISENYATSKWCLEELRMIMELLHVEEGVSKVIPIFYEVEPCAVKRQEGSFATAFANMGRLEKVSKWKAALTQVSNLFGYISSNCVDEATMVDEVVQNVSDRLFSMHTRDNPDNIIGMSCHMESLGSLLEMDSKKEVRFVGISGMGGIGKTTIAKSLYGQFSRQFSARCFLDDVKEIYNKKGPSHLRKKFLSTIFGAGSHNIERLKNNKVFVVFDNVDKMEQLQALAEDPSWFAPGSRIIITTRDKGLLHSCRVDAVYPVKCLDQNESLQMFKHLVYRGRPPPNGFEKLLIRASRLAHGLPYALNAYSMYLLRKTTEEWEKAVIEFEKAPHNNILDILKRSYEGLATRDKIAFLHVACLFNGDHFLRVSTLLDNGESGINVLVEQSLVDISAEGNLQIHALVEKTGRNIVFEESNYYAHRQRILWDSVETYDVLHNNTGTDKIEGLTLHTCDMPGQLCIGDNSFKQMKSVKFLKFYKHLNRRRSKLRLQQDTASLPGMLRLLHWDAYPLETLPSRFFPRNLVELTLRYSNLQNLSNKTLNLQKLKRLDVSGSKDLRELLYISSDLQLEELIVEGCKKLEWIFIPIRRRNTLRILDLSNCDGLQRLPPFIPKWISVAEKPIFFRCQGTRLKFEIKALGPFAFLSLEGYIEIRLQELKGDAEHLFYVSEQQTTDELRLRRPSHWPKSQTFGNLLHIKRSYYNEGGAPFNCVTLSAFSYLAELKLINLNIHEFPNDIGRLHSLEKLDLTGNDFKYLPTDLGSLEKLNHIILCHCRKLEKLPNLTQLQTLKLCGCTNLRSLPVAHGGRYRLLELDLDNCRNVESLTQQLRQFTKLMHLDLSSHDFQTIPTSITELLRLETLCVNNCKELKSLRELPPSLNYLNAHGCNSLETVSLPFKHSIKHLDLSNCSRLNQGEEVITQFLSGGEHEKVSLRFACIPGTVVPSYFDNQSKLGESIPLPSKLLGFAACVMVACDRRFHLQFPASSYSWNWEAGGVFRINLRPNIYRLSGTEIQKAVTVHYLVIIKVLRNKKNDEISNFLFKPDLQFSQEFLPPPVEIKKCGYHIIHQTA